MIGYQALARARRLSDLLFIASFAIILFMMIYGLTGGMGCGKSLLQEFLASNGMHVIDLDYVCRELYSSDCFDGKYDVIVDGKVDRSKLRQLMFYEGEYDNVMSIVVPKLTAMVDAMVTDGCIVSSAILLYPCDYVIRIESEFQHSRIASRDGHSPELIEKFLAKQQQCKADYTIYNNGSKEEFLNQGQRLLNEIRNNRLIRSSN